MGLITIHNTATSQKTDHDTVNFNKNENEIDKLLNEYSDVFEGLGSLPRKLHLEVDKAMEPIQHRPRKVPITTKEELRKSYP